ncbi:MAG: BamA/TamA family outer membrane protein [Deltaproteobacteria bacterium]|nr:BamA/TamA family outer membrane protein [Deltaproteobacteria bacterium]
MRSPLARWATIALLLLTLLPGGRSLSASLAHSGAPSGALALTLAPTLARSALEGAGGESGQRLVSRIELRSDLPRNLARELRSLLVIAPGEPLSEDRVRRTLRNLQASGRFAEAAVYARPAPSSVNGDVVVTVAMWSNLLVSEIRLEGELGLGENRLRAVLEQSVGQPLIEGKLLRSLYRLQDLYQEVGFLEAEIRLRVRRRTTAASVVSFLIESGPRTRIGSVEFEGDLGPFQAVDLLERLQGTPGEPFRSQDAKQDLELLHEWFVSQGFRTARVTAKAPVRFPQEHRVDLAYRVDLGPLVEVEVVGADLKKLERQGLLSFLDEEGYDSALLIRARQQVERYFQKKGYYEVEASLRERVEKDRLVVEVEVNPGTSFTLREVRFEGNETFRDSQLGELMETRPKQRLRVGSGHLVDEILSRDMDNLRSFYALEGFFEARLEKPKLETLGDELFLTLTVHEGPQRRIASLSWVGLGEAELLEKEGESDPSQPDVASWLRTAPLTEGGGFHPRRLEEAVEGLTALYRASGFEWVQVESEVSWPTESLADVTIRVREGSQMLLDRLIIRGNLETRTEVVRRFVGLESGQPVSRSRLLEVERNLARLGIFSRVDVTLSPGEVGGTQRDVVVRVEEGRAQRVSYGLGYDSEDGVRGLLGFSHKNLWGRAFSLQLDARASSRDERYRLLVSQPSLGTWAIPLTYSLFSFDEQRESFNQQSVGLRIDGFKDFRFGRWGLAYDFRSIQLSDVEESLDRIDPLDREIDISSLIPNLLIDFRDDPFDPTQGWSSVLEVQYAFPTLSADANFLKVFVQQTGYLNLRRAGVIAASLRLGGIEPLGGSRDLADDDNPIPIGERFFAGGRTSHRAFRRDLLGLDGSTRISVTDSESGQVDLFPAGGNGLVLANLEYRFPIAGALGGTLFADAGNVWRDWRAVNLSQTRYSLGLGLRYRSPIGPVRLEVGWNLDQQAGESSSEIHLTFGNPF